MPRWKESDLNAYQNRNRSPRKTAKLECNPVSPSLEAVKSQEGAAGRIHLRFTSRRKRLCDPDNLSCKYILDSIRFAKIIPGDEPDKITLEVTQEKIQKQEREETIIEITYP